MTTPLARQVAALGLLALGGCAERAGPSGERVGARAQAVELTAGYELSDELALDAPPTYVPAQMGVSKPSYGDGNYLVGFQYGQTYASRVDRDGKVLDRWGITLSEQPTVPALAFDGTEWIAVWGEYRDATQTVRDLRCARVATDGSVLDPGGALVAVDLKSGGPAALLFDGSKLLYASGYDWQFIDTSCAAIGERFSPPNTTNFSSLVFDGTGYVYVYGQPNGGGGTKLVSIWLQHLDASGAVQGSPVLVDTLDPGAALWVPFPVGGALASRLDTTVVAYHYTDGANPDTIRFRKIPASGAVGPALTLAITTGPNQPVVVGTDAGFVVSSPGGDTRIELVDFSGSESVSDAFPSNAAWWGSGESDGQRVLGGSDQLVVVDEALAPLNPAVPLLEVAENEERPRAATSRDAALVVFQRDPSSLGAARLTKAGTALDAAPLELGTAPSNLASVASNGTDFMVAWDTPSPYRIRVRSVAADVGLGAPLDLGNDVGTSVRQYYPRIASDGSGYLVAWWRSANTAVEDELVAARISGAGAVLDEPPLSLLHRYPGGSPAGGVAFDGSSYLVARSEGSSAMELAHVAPNDGSLSWQSLPWPGTVFDLVWGANQGLLLFLDEFGALVATRLDGAGSALDDPPITLVATSSHFLDDFNTAASWDGSVYWTVRLDKRRPGMPVTFARITTAGALLDPDGIDLPPNDGVALEVSSFALASWGPGSVLAYARADHAREFRSSRARARLLGLASGGAGAGGTAGTGTGGGTSGDNAGEASGASAGQSGADNGSGGADTGGAPASTGGRPSADGGGPSLGGSRATDGAGSGGTAGHGATGASGGQSGEPRCEGGSGGEGVTGQAGAPTTGATGGTSGASAGKTGKSGAAGRSGDAGNAGKAGQGGSPGTPGGGESCGCRVPRRETNSGLWLSLLVAMLVLSRRRGGRSTN